MIRRLFTLLGICLFLGASSTPALADSGMPSSPYAYKQLDDPQQEAQAHRLMQTIRCLVCQGQSIADSDAELAGDMRSLVRERIAAGEKPEAIRDWLISRYGRWVSYEPPLDAVTWPLWIMPLVFLGFGLWLVRGRLRKTRS